MTSIKARDLHPSQRKALMRVIWFIRNHERDDVTSIRYAIRPLHKDSVSVTLMTRRSDCDRYSPRQVVCRIDMHVFIGKRGGITVADARTMSHNFTKHAAYMLHARV